MDEKEIRGTLSGQGYVRDCSGRNGKFPIIILMRGIIYAWVKVDQKPNGLLGADKLVRGRFFCLEGNAGVTY